MTDFKKPSSFNDRPKKSFGGKKPFNRNAGGSRDDSRPSVNRSSFDKPRDFDKPREDRPQRSFSDRPARPFNRDGGGERRSFGDRPQRSFSDRPRDDTPREDRPARSFSDRPARPFNRDGGGERRSFGDRPQRSFSDRPRDDTPREDRPQRSFSDRPARPFNRDGGGERRSFGGSSSGAPRRSFGGAGSRPPREQGSFGNKPYNSENKGREENGNTFTPREDRPARPFNRDGGERRPFNRDGGSRDGGGERRSFGDRPQRSFSDRPKRDFGDRPREDRPQRSFSDRPREDRPARPFNRDGGGERRSSGKNFSGGDRRAGKGFDKPKSLVSLENILHLFANNKGVINLVEQKFADNIKADFLHKIEVLTKLEAVSTKDGNTYKVNTSQAMLNLDKYVIAKIIKPIANGHYLCSVVALDGKKLEDNEFLINELKEDLADRFMLLEVSLVAEKLIARAVFYLKEFEKTNLEHLKKSTEDNLELKGIYRKMAETPMLITINYRSRDPILIQNMPDTVKEGSLIRATLVLENNVRIANFIEVIAETKEATSLSMLSVHQYNLPFEFSQESLDMAAQKTSWELGTRKDIRHLPLVTIDDEDAKDFDDAIYAEQISSTPLQYKIYVAIADVSDVVIANTQLDIEAKTRGNSVYLPGFVIPMLPESISNGMCSLNPDVERGCMLAEIVINHNGEIESYEFSKALMKSKARLTYTKVQLAVDNSFDAEKLKTTDAKDTMEILDSVLKPIYEAFKLLNKATKKRHALNIQTKETKIILDKDDNILDIKVRESKEANKIVEEFMVAANVASARFFADNEKASLAIYRVHDKPTTEKLMDFGKVLKTLAIYDKVPEELKNGEFFNEIIAKYKDEPFFNSLNESVLRAQAQAIYSTNNIGHFGLALKQYCHFTSPIRRYSDLMVHRLIANILNPQEYPFDFHIGSVNEICEHISNTERAAFFAEMNAKERILTKWLKDKIGEDFEGQISSVTQAGLFINLKDIQVSGLLPMRLISKEYVNYNPNSNTITDMKNKRTYKIGDFINVKILDANEIKGMITFEQVSGK